MSTNHSHVTKNRLLHWRSSKLGLDHIRCWKCDMSKNCSCHCTTTIFKILALLSTWDSKVFSPFQIQCVSIYHRLNSHLMWEILTYQNLCLDYDILRLIIYIQTNQYLHSAMSFLHSHNYLALGLNNFTYIVHVKNWFNQMFHHGCGLKLKLREM